MIAGEYSQPRFIDASFKAKIAQYLQANLAGDLKKVYADFTPLITERIQTLCDNWLRELRKTAKEGLFSKELSHIARDSNEKMTIYHLDPGAYALIKKQFLAKSHCVEIKATEPMTAYDSITNGLLDVLPRGSVFSLTAGWSPQNPYLYLKSDVATKHHNPQPNFNSHAHFEKAKKGIETDIILESKEGIKNHAHQIYLNNHSDYFQTMFNSSLKEGLSKTAKLNYSTTSVEHLLQFIYQGQIDSTAHNNLTELIELLGLAKECLISDLFDYCVDLGNDFLFKNESLSPEQIKQFMEAAFLFDIKNFFKPCLVAAEKLELAKDATAETTVDWSVFEPTVHGPLIALAAKNSLEKTEQKLIDSLNKILE